jgi:hypothetical protein
MRAPRFKLDFDRPTTRWTRVPNLDVPRVPNRKKILAIVSPPIVIGDRRKPIRRVLIYDNHPATLRLLHDGNLVEPRMIIWHILLSAALAIVAVLCIFLLFR